MRPCSSMAVTRTFSTSPTLKAFLRSVPRGVPVSLAGTSPRPPANRTKTPNGSSLSTLASTTSPTRGGGGGAGRAGRSGSWADSGRAESALTDRPIRSPFFGSSSILSTCTWMRVADLEQVLGLGDPIPGKLGDVNEPLDATQVHEGPVVLHVRDDALEDGTRGEPLAGRPRLGGAFLLEKGAAGEHHIALIGALDAELEPLADERGRVLHEANINLGHGAEGPHVVDGDLEATFVDRRHHAFDRKARARGFHERLAAVVVGLRMAAGDHHPTIAGLHHHAVDDVADAGLHLALLVDQLHGLNHPLGHAGAELEEGHVGPNLDDLSGHLLAHLEPAAIGARLGPLRTDPQTSPRRGATPQAWEVARAVRV